MDPFAQSRADDDLFADDFEPVNEQTYEAVPAPETIEHVAATPSTTTVKVHNAEHGVETNTEPKPRDDRRGRGARGGRGGRGTGNQNGMANSRFATHKEGGAVPAPPKSSKPTAPPQTESVAPTEVATKEIPQPDSEAQSQSANPVPQPELPLRTPAVRGDRSATGGPAHKKLTEEELTAKLAQMAIINAQKTERHRASEADQAAFQHREKELEKERKEKAIAERKNERVMEMERAKNRERKMKAQGGREWDSEKREEDIVDRKGRSSEFVRGGFGGVVRGGGLAGSRFATQDGDSGDKGEAQNGRGGSEARGKNRGRGGRGGARGGKSQGHIVPSAEDFPALSAAAVTSPPAAGDWADEMATPIDEKRLEV